MAKGWQLDFRRKVLEKELSFSSLEFGYLRH
jgi:hypothetical protein